MRSGDSARERPLRILVCPQEFKGTLTAPQATELIARALREVLPRAEVIEQPMADGGSGTAEIVGHARNGKPRSIRVPDAYGHPVDAEFILLEDGETAVIDSAAAVSLTATAVERRDPLRSTSRGVGLLVLAAFEAGARQIILGVGGTASSDGGAGLASALGLRLLDARAEELPDGGLHLARLALVEDRVPNALRELRVRVAVDVRNPLTGPEGAAAVYGAQKGLLPWQAPALDAAVARWALRLREDLARGVEAMPGTGAGGGIPAGVLAALPHARIESGAALVAEAVRLRVQIEAADLVVTGEGSLDAQTAFGKSVAHVLGLASGVGVPCLAVAGVIESFPAGLADAESASAMAASLGASDGALADPERFVGEATRALIGRWLARPRS